MKITRALTASVLLGSLVLTSPVASLAAPQPQPQPRQERFDDRRSPEPQMDRPAPRRGHSDKGLVAGATGLLLGLAIRTSIANND